MTLSHSVIDLLPLKNPIKEVDDNLVMDSKRLKFVSIYTVYEDNNGAIVVETSPSMTPFSNHITVNYHWFRRQVRNEFVIQNIESEIQRAYISPKVFKMNCLPGLGN